MSNTSDAWHKGFRQPEKRFRRLWALLASAAFVAIVATVATIVALNGGTGGVKTDIRSSAAPPGTSLTGVTCTTQHGQVTAQGEVKFDLGYWHNSINYAPAPAVVWLSTFSDSHENSRLGETHSAGVMAPAGPGTVAWQVSTDISRGTAKACEIRISKVAQ